MNQINIIPVSKDGSAAFQTVIPFIAPKQIEDKSVGVVLDDVHGVISRVLLSARAAGRDYVDQCRLAANAIVAVRPDLSFQEAHKAVFRMREQEQQPDTAKTAA